MFEKLEAIVSLSLYTDTVYMAEAFGNGVFEVYSKLTGMRLVCFPSRPSSTSWGLLRLRVRRTRRMRRVGCLSAERIDVGVQRGRGKSSAAGIG